MTPAPSTSDSVSPDLAYGKLLLEVLANVIHQLFGVNAKLIDRRYESDKRAPFEVSAIIGLAGAVKGNIVLSFPLNLAEQLSAQMLGTGDSESISEQDIADTVGEINNIVAGNLLAKLEPGLGSASKLSTPSVVIGIHRVLWSSKDAPCDFMLVSSELGTFVLEHNIHSVTEEK